MDSALGNLISLKMFLLIAWRLDKMSFESPIQPKLFCDM